MSKTVLMPGDSLTPEQIESIEKFKKESSDKTEHLLEQSKVLEQTQEEVVALLLQTKMEALEDRVIVFPDLIAKVTEGGIHKPDEVIEREKPACGTVIVVGPGKLTGQGMTNKLLLLLVKILTTLFKKAGFIFASDVKEVETEMKKPQIPLKPGDRIQYGRFAGTPIDEPATKRELLVMRPMDIFVKL